jgi:hypothetical protein
MKIALIAVLSGALVAVGAQALPSAIGSEDSTDALVRPAASRTTEDASVRKEDRRADRRDDSRTDRREDRREDRRAGGAREAGEDISGPCDEAEHANDPRCTGVAAPRADDDGHHGDDDRGGDRGGDNSGPGSSGSGHGSGGDDDGGHSGSGHGGGHDD